MKRNRTTYRIATGCISFIILFAFATKIHSQTSNSNKQAVMDTIQTSKKQDSPEQIFIDKFLVPQNAVQEFSERMSINRNFIKKLPGFIADNAYERTDEQGNLIVITVAIWKNEDAIRKAKEAVQAEYKREGFDMQGMLKRLNIIIDRGMYKKMGNQ